MGDEVHAALYAYLCSHARRENRVINNRGYQYLVFCECQLCTDAKAALGISPEDADNYQVVHDSNPPERVGDNAES